MNGKDTDPPETKITKGLFKGLAELKKYPTVAFISASFGTVMGIIPGVGEFVAQFFSYSTARSLSKNPSKFGYGAPEGLIACETSNNAVPAAAMIPLLALGVPGEALTAMMMVVFFDAGIGVSFHNNESMNGSDLGSVYQFENRLGIGYERETYRSVLNIFHFSNGGLEGKNDGVDILMLSVSKYF